MPLYEYKCDTCGRIEEKFLPVERRNELRECPKCKGKMELQISKTSFKFHDPTELEAQYGRGGINDYD
jgi:putative FmdB family regulatory protein